MIKIRKYKKIDEEKVKKLITEVLNEIFKKTIVKKWENFNEYELFLVAEDTESGKLVATAALKNQGNQIGKIKRMYILKEYRNRGIGQKLFNKILDFAKKNNFNRIILSTEKRLKEAYNFYTKNGFSEIKNINWQSDFADLKKEDIDINRMIFMQKNLKNLK